MALPATAGLPVAALLSAGGSQRRRRDLLGGAKRPFILTGQRLLRRAADVVLALSEHPTQIYFLAKQEHQPSLCCPQCEMAAHVTTALHFSLFLLLQLSLSRVKNCLLHQAVISLPPPRTQTRPTPTPATHPRRLTGPPANHPGVFHSYLDVSTDRAPLQHVDHQFFESAN